MGGGKGFGVALTLTKVTGGAYTSGNHRVRSFTVTFDSSYTTGGLALTPANVGLKTITSAVPEGAFVKTDRSDGVEVHYSISQQKLLAYQSTTGAPSKLIEVAGLTDLSAYSGRIRFEGF